jgi:prephenate dehydratase
MSLKIGISGMQGSFSEEAANYYCHKEKITDYDLKYLVSVENVLLAINNNEIDNGVFPIENSNGGIVYEAVYAISKYVFNIIKIFEIDVRHCLMAKKGINPVEIKKIVSHDQALKQCRMYLKRKWPDVEIIQWEDTAKAAKDLSEGVLPPDTAVIAPKRAAELYNLDILEEGVQDLKFNFTTFLFVSKKAA